MFEQRPSDGTVDAQLALSNQPIDRVSEHASSLPARVVVIAVGISAAVTSMAAANGASGLLGAGLGLLMLAIAVADARSVLSPDPLSIAALLLGIANLAILGEGDLLAGAVARAVVVTGAFLGLRLAYARFRGRHGIGLGDVKLAAVAGIWLDWSLLPIAIEIAALSALASCAVRRYVLRHRLRPSSRLPFGLFFAPAISIGWVLQTALESGW